ncbi:MAG: hypothetical protein LBI66_11005 [Burkholderiaceae bacterium]|nr:hypothetical protein [Burkholderiaceae bacterium]
MTPRSQPMVVAPTIEGMLLCDEAVADTKIRSMEEAYAFCQQRKLDGSAAITRLLDRLEPGGPKGQVQIGYTATLQLLALYRQTARGWEIDEAKADSFLNIIRKVQRPVVLYFSADHFDSVGPLTAELAKDPVNLMQLRDGKPLELGYFGYRILPYTLSTDPAIPVNHYRFKALEYMAKKIRNLPQTVQDRIIAYTLPGELHHMFPDFEGGMAAYQDIRVTDYSPGSVAGFRQWLRAKYKDIARFKAETGLDYPSFDAIPAPSKDIRKEKLGSFGEHYDAYADGILPVAGWLWDPGQTIAQLDLYVDGQRVGPMARGLNRLDVYRAVDNITSPNTGFRYNLDYSQMAFGRHVVQVVAESKGRKYQLANLDFTIVPRNQGKVLNKMPPRRLGWLPPASQLQGQGVRSWLDMPGMGKDVYYNPLARDWNHYRESQVYAQLAVFHERAVAAGLPAAKLYSHQIIPDVNPSWNPQLFASTQTLDGKAPWRQGLNMYGGATNSDWLRGFMKQHGIGAGYGAPEFNPQQWKVDGTHKAALQAHYDAGALFISPYYFSIVDQRFKGSAEHGVNRMELSPDNPKDGSDKFYQAIVEFARQ